MEEARESGWTVLTKRQQFDSINASSTTFPLLSLFTADHMSFEIDRDPKIEPSLAEMTWRGLELLDSHLSPTDDKGFFLMVEG
jgi:alkaline phosphatase